MSSLKYSLVLATLATPWLVALTGRSGLAFSITPQQPGANQQYTPTVSSSYGSVTLNPLSVTALPLGGTSGFLQDLNAAFPTWTVNAAPNNLAGSFSIEGYQAVDTPTSTSENVGGQLLLTYNPSDGDPTTADSSLHWIQRVYDNHAIATTRSTSGNITVTDQGYGNYEDKIDTVTGSGGQLDPFYDTYGSSPTTPGGNFYDIVGRNDPQDPNIWSGEVYLVKLTAPQTLTVYNGVSWGWQNTINIASNGGADGCSGCSSNISLTPTSVPEPNSALGLLALGAWGIAQRLKIRKAI